MTGSDDDCGKSCSRHEGRAARRLPASPEVQGRPPWRRGPVVPRRARADLRATPRTSSTSARFTWTERSARSCGPTAPTSPPKHSTTTPAKPPRPRTSRGRSHRSAIVRPPGTPLRSSPWGGWHESCARQRGLTLTVVTSPLGRRKPLRIAIETCNAANGRRDTCTPVNRPGKVGGSRVPWVIQTALSRRGRRPRQARLVPALHKGLCPRSPRELTKTVLIRSYTNDEDRRRGLRICRMGSRYPSAGSEVRGAVRASGGLREPEQHLRVRAPVSVCGVTEPRTSCSTC